MSGSDDTSFLQLPKSWSHKDYEKTIGILNDSLKTPAVATRSSHLRHADYTPLSRVSNSLFDAPDSTLGFMRNTPAAKASASVMSFNATPGSSFRQSLLAQTAVEDDVAMTDVNLLQHEDPSAVACRGMFGDFAGSYESGKVEGSPFESLGRYEQICSDNTMLLRSLAKRAVVSHPSFVRTNEMLSLVNMECQTWRLVKSLFLDRIDTERFARESESEDMMLDECSVKPRSEKRLVSALYERDSVLRQAQLVVDWLESSVADVLDDFYQKVEFSIDKMGAWENTLHMLKHSQTHGGRLGSSRSYVDRLDPDAPIRQRKSLLDQDVEDDINLLEYMFACIRGGQIAEAQRVSAKVGQMWRASTLAGWQLYHDPNFEELGRDGAVQIVEGNQYRDIWKAACWKASEDDRLPLVERAMYAALCGNLSRLLPYCQSWHDYVWAYFKVMVDQMVENHIHTSFSGTRPLLPLPSAYSDTPLTAERIFTEIQSTTVENVRRQSNAKFNQIQKYIITGDLDGLINLMASWCEDTAKQPHHHLLRFMAHLTLFLMTHYIVKEDNCTCILEAYVNLLINENQADIVAPYVATLPQDLQVRWYALFLEGIQGTETRRRCLDLADSCGLDVMRITKLVVENIRNRSSNEIAATAESLQDTNTSEEDLQKVDALEWLIFNTKQRREALLQANAMIRVFLGLHKLQACRLTLRKLPTDTVDVVLKLSRAKVDDGEIPAEVENAVKEYLCVQAYLDAHESFTDWFQHFNNARPKAPEISFGADFSQRVAYEHRVNQYEMELGRWQHSLDLQTDITVERIYNVLLFVNGGWLVDIRYDEDCDVSRTHQMALLRQLCLPLMCSLLHQVLHTTKRYKECIQIADTIASEHHELYKVFRIDELQNLLKKIRESSVALLDAGLDPLGYLLS